MPVLDVDSPGFFKKFEKIGYLEQYRTTVSEGDKKCGYLLLKLMRK